MQRQVVYARQQPGYVQVSPGQQVYRGAVAPQQVYYGTQPMQVSHAHNNAHCAQPQATATMYTTPAQPGQPQRATVVQSAVLELPSCPDPEPITLHIQPPPAVQGQPRLINADATMVQAHNPCHPDVGHTHQVYSHGAVYPASAHAHYKPSGHLYY